MAMMTAFNTPLTPYGEGRRSVEAREAMADWKAHADCQTDPIFNDLFVKILQDRGEQHRLHEDGVREEIWADLVGHAMWQKEATKCNMTRFMSLVQRFEEEDSVWHSRLAGWLYLAITTGVLKNSTLASSLATVKNAREAALDERAPMNRAKKELEKLRASSKNALHFGILLYSDFDNKVRQRIIRCIAAPVRRWHADQNETLRSVPATVKWEKDMGSKV